MPSVAGPAQAVYVITGIRAAGRSTIGQAPAERLARSVHLRGDLFRRMIVNGRADPNPGAGSRGAAAADHADPTGR